MHFVREHQRLANGILRPVAAHYRHSKRKDDVSCCAETVEHKAAKHAISIYPFRYSVKCASWSCNNRINIQIDHIDQCNLVKKIEHRININDNEYILDVAFLQDDFVHSAVEVKQTHAIPKEKRNDLTNEGIAWVEVSAKEVLNAVKKGSLDLDCLRCASLMCHECEENARIKNEVEMQMEERKQAEAERAAKLAIVATNPLPEGDRLQWVWTNVCQVAQDIFKMDDATTKTVTELAVNASKNELYIEQGSNRLLFGKHKGRCVRYVFELAEDKEYVRWLANWTGYKGERGPEEYENKRFHPDLPGRMDAMYEARDLLKSTCLLCFESNLYPVWKRWCSDCFRRAI